MSGGEDDQEEDFEWFMAAARTFLSSIKTGQEAEFQIGQVRTEAASDRRRSQTDAAAIDEPLLDAAVVVQGKHWKPSGEPFLLVSFPKVNLSYLFSLSNQRLVEITFGHGFLDWVPGRDEAETTATLR